MDRSPSEHVGTAELAKLLEESRRRAESALDAADVHPHLAACPACREQFEDLALLDRQLDRQMKGMRPAESPPQGDCPGAALWREISGGLTPPGETLAYLEHAGRCDHCGPLLREAVAEVSDLNGEITEAERTLIAILESARPEWQQRLAQQITGTQHSGPDRGSTPWWKRWLAVPRLAVPYLAAPRLAMAGASLLAIVAAGSWVIVHRDNTNNARRNQPAAASHLLARAYTEKRTLELRIAGANYAPLRVSLGPAASFTSRPAALLKAEALIASQLESHPTDPSWLQAKAQADVLEGKYDAAVEALRHALQLEPHSPAILTDLATAYFQRAQQEDRNEDFGAAYESLSQALKLHPDDPVALFNRAIVAEHQFLYHQALDDWDHYLRVDPGSQWGEEARNRANAVREKLKQHESRMTPLLSPAQLTARLADASLGSEVDQRVADPRIEDQSIVDQRIEEYLHEAVRSWLPQAFPESKNTADSNVAQALFFLAELTNRQHGDQWLTDLLRGSSAPHFPQAANALARAVKANDAGEYDVSRKQADLAEKLFRASGNTAGTLRAQFEQIFAAQMTRRSEACRRQAIPTLAESEKYSYTWLHIQLGLEQSVCSILMGDIGTAERAARRAMDLAQKRNHGVLYLRALGFLAEARFFTGDDPGAWKLLSAGLERYWSAQLPAMRGYNLYYTLGLNLEGARWPNLLEGIWREAVALIDSDEDLLVRGVTHNLLANAATAAHKSQFAEQQYAQAARLYALAPRTDASRSYTLETNIRIAQLESRLGQFDAAITRLTSVQDAVRLLSNDYLVEIFYSALGEVQLRSHHAAEAEQAFRPALRLAEQNLASLTSGADRTRWSKDAATVYLGLAEAELVQGHEQESLDLFEWYLGAPQRVGKPGHAMSQRTAEPSQSLSDPSQLPSRLPLLSNQTVLAYGVLPDGLAIWVYDNRGVSAKWIPKSPQELQDLTADFYAECSDPSSELSALRRDSQALYSQLIAPVESRLDPKRTLVIETEGFLARLPFEALMDSSGQYLIARGPIVHSPGPYAEARMHPDIAITPDLTALVVGSAASLPDAGLFVVPNVPAGAAAVASGFHSPRVLKGPEATLGAVRSALPAAAVFHFAGHAITISNHTGLMLEGRDTDVRIDDAGKNDARTGAPVLLDANALRNLNLQNMQLAVLAACSTDSGEGASRGFDSVAEALQTSGVPHVVASRWTVDSVEANAFMDYFYRSLLSGQPVSNATRLTSQRMLLNPRTSHPYYWAAFAAYGRP